MNAQEFGMEIANCVRRVVRSNFQQEQATPGERVKLAMAEVPLTDPLVQNYAVWRKSVLWIAAISFLLLTLFHLIGFETIAYQMAKQVKQTEPYERASSAGRSSMIAEAKRNVENQFHKSNLEMIDGIFIFIEISQVVGTILVVVAACMWHHLPRSKRLVRIGWLIMFLTPFLMSLLPLSAMLDWEKVDVQQFGSSREQVTAQLQVGLGVAFALWFFMIVGPKALSIFAGVMRSSMTLKTLLPEATSPGWAAVLMAPLCALFLIVITSIVIQIYGNVWLLLGLLCLMLAPLSYLLQAKHLLQPHTPEEMLVIVRRIRVTAGVFNGLGFIFLLVFVVVVEFFGVIGAIKFFLGLVASLTALTVVSSDFLLALIWKGYEQSKRFQGTAWQTSLESKFDVLSTVGLTNFLSSHVPPAPRAVPGMPAPPPAGGPPPVGSVSVSLESMLISLDDPAPPPGSGPSKPPPPPGR